MKRKCICEICTCGRHRCPHNPTMIFEKSGKPCVLTEYVEKYPQYDQVLPPKSMKPKEELQENRGRMEGVSTFKSDYLPYDVLNRPRRHQEVYKPKPGHMDHGTTYKRDFNTYEIQPVAPVRPVERRQNIGKFDGNPTYKDDFKAWDIQKRELAKQDNAYQPPKEKFGNLTTFQDDYFQKELIPRESYRPPNVSRRINIPFDGLTSHRISYIPYKLEPKLVRDREEYKPSSQPFDDLTTHRLNYKGALGELTKSFKPEHGKVGSSARFEGSSEFKDSFQPWLIPSRYIHKVDEYIPPNAHMESDTTTHRDYVQHQLSYVAPARPVSHGRRSSAPFQGNTTMKDDFKAWEAQRQGIIKREHQLPNASGKFDGLTTFRAHYQPHEISLTENYKPYMAVRNYVPFEGETMYHSEYTAKKNEICPAVYPSPPGYVFETVDSRGHKMYRKTLTPEMNTFSKENGNKMAQAIAVMS
ncbi:stabilizer of axonemal microtubules 2 [Pelobates cultripes]|uniref:Stabilizer of axonemal microtubules 2 n=1 Tax=Pelobates cultripes TaxID=61616 RepID=A0AAD1RLN2_PELCU|nr:stabilizer of axonemal microtubules 2 [Pelobates cultripes]